MSHKEQASEQARVMKLSSRAMEIKHSFIAVSPKIQNRGRRSECILELKLPQIDIH